MSNTEARYELSKLMDSLRFTSGSQKIRTELGGLVESMYVNEIISRSEYHEFMAEIK